MNENLFMMKGLMTPKDELIQNYALCWDVIEMSF